MYRLLSICVTQTVLLCLCKVLSLLLMQGSRDNMSIIIVAFEAAPKICDLAKQKEAELDARLENKIKGLLRCCVDCMHRNVT